VRYKLRRELLWSTITVCIRETYVPSQSLSNIFYSLDISGRSQYRMVTAENIRVEYLVQINLIWVGSGYTFCKVPKGM